MEIDKTQGIQVDAYVNQVHDKNKVESSEEISNKAAAKTDTVVISDAAKQVQEVRTQLDAIPEVDEGKVAQLRKEIEDGTYQRSADEIAAKMIREGLINDGDGSFGDPTVFPVNGASTRTTAMVDMNGDGDLDLLFANGSHNLAVFWQESPGAFLTTPTTTPSTRAFLT